MQVALCCMLVHCNNLVKIVMLYIVYFYRSTRMHSADYAVARCLSVRLSVRLPVTRRY